MTWKSPSTMYSYNLVVKSMLTHLNIDFNSIQISPSWHINSSKGRFVEACSQIKVIKYREWSQSRDTLDNLKIGEELFYF